MLEFFIWHDVCLHVSLAITDMPATPRGVNRSLYSSYGYSPGQSASSQMVSPCLHPIFC